MTQIRQRQPRIRDEGYLAYLRRLPCACCGAAPPCDAAHIRSANLAFGKRQTGKAEKPDDKWALPLTRACHFRQHSMAELTFWKNVGVNPFKLAARIHTEYVAEHGDTSVKKQRIRKIRARKPRELRAPIQSRGFQKDGPKQKITNRGFPK